MNNAARRVAGAMVGAVLVMAAVAGCSSSDDASDVAADDAASGTSAPVRPVVAFVRPTEGGGATVEYDDGTWACATRSTFVVVGQAVGGPPDTAATAEEAALGQRAATEVTIEQIGEQLDAPVEGSPDERVDLVAFAVREDGELIAVEVVEDDGTGWARSSSTTCDGHTTD